MKYLMYTLLMGAVMVSCKDCIECTYADNKGGNTTKFCSSTKSDREAFIEAQEAEAVDNGSQAFCRKVSF